MMAETLEAIERESRGTRNARRDRAEGRTPAVLYGHGGPAVSLSVDAVKITRAIQQGVQLVQLAGDVDDCALIREIQWDTFGNDVLHIDFTRVAADERIEVTVTLELRGMAPGTKVGGVVNQLVHDVAIECPAMAIPEKIEININHLELGDSILASVIELPEEVQLLCEPETALVQCVEPLQELDEEQEQLAVESVEPEVIGRKAAEEEEEGDKAS
jgi:large subunit ribosomal protein L25